MDTIWNAGGNLKSPFGNNYPITIYSNNIGNFTYQLTYLNH